ncbi:MAG: SRPBCC family protein [Chitinophagales bacterium]|nr:SRPBCC family protein [Chitinophagales bacterium]MBX7224964.1 SRPBCC family protein [Chitinophagales bacterium]
MSIVHLKRVQLLNGTKEGIWDFFTSPKNLNDITPNGMCFEILSELPDKVYEGLFIRYKIRPFLNFPMNWVTEITHVKDDLFFVDEQRQGPYKLWHHEHHFKTVENGVEMTDILHYDIGKGILGQIAGALFVHKQVRDIFDYRYKKLEELFNSRY